MLKSKKISYKGSTKSSEQRFISTKTGSSCTTNRKNNNRKKISKTFNLSRNTRKPKKLTLTSRKVGVRAEVEVEAIGKSRRLPLEEK